MPCGPKPASSRGSPFHSLDIFGQLSRAPARVVVDSGPVYEATGKWLTDKHYIYWLYTKSTSRYAPPGTRDMDRLIDIADDYFVTARRDGKRAKYERIK